jgi:uncharacterized protein YjcR
MAQTRTEKKEKNWKFYLKSLKGRDYLEYLGVDGMIILKWILKYRPKDNVVEWILWLGI